MRWPYSAREEDPPTYHLFWDPSPGGKALFAVQEAGDMSQPRHERSGLRKSPSYLRAILIPWKENQAYRTEGLFWTSGPRLLEFLSRVTIPDI